MDSVFAATILNSDPDSEPPKLQLQRPEQQPPNPELQAQPSDDKLEHNLRVGKTVFLTKCSYFSKAGQINYCNNALQLFRLLLLKLHFICSVVR